MPGDRKNAPRLRDFDYLGSHAYFVTNLTYQKNPYFTDGTVVDIVMPVLRQCSETRHFAIYSYCFMPNHVHLLAVGEDNSNLAGFMKVFKQASSFAFKKKFGGVLWHGGYYEHVLRKEESLSDVTLYILNNPVRASLVKEYRDYPFSGSFVFDISEIGNVKG